MQRRVLAEEVKPPSTTDHFNERHALPTKITPSAAKPPFFAPIIKRPTARKRFFPEAGTLDWSDWRWQVRSRVKDLAGLARIINLSEDEASAIRRHTGSLPVGITPYYLTLFDRDDSSQPIRRTHIPVNDEYLRLPGEADDPLGEDHDAAVPGLVHRYPDRVLLDLLPLLHPFAHGGGGRRRVPVQRAPVGARHRLYRGAPGNPRRAALGRRSPDPGRREAGMAAVAPAGHPPCRVPAHRHEGAGGGAAAGDA